jgi:predicted AlkP superfamily phosphohydrolase/phosphomutase
MAKRRVMAIGLDAATFDLMRPWLAEGKLPALARLMREGASGELASVPTMNSGAAWPSFATGLNPGKHGVYWLVEYKPDSYDLRPINATSRHGETLWARLSRLGRRVAVLNVPITWPAEPVNGVLVAGWDCPGVYSRGFTHPPEFAEELLRACDGEFIIRATSESPQDTLDGAIERMRAQTMSHLKAARYILGKGPWDLSVLVFTATDMAIHLLWKTIDPRHPDYDPHEAARYGNAIYDVYRQCDDAVAELLQYADENTTVIVMSDHGAGIKGGAAHHINQWLRSEGLLKYGKDSPDLQPNQSALLRLRRGVMWLAAQAMWEVRRHRLLTEGQRQRLKAWLPGLRALRRQVEMRLYSAQIDWGHSQAYANDADDFVRINLAGREPQGIVAPEDYEALRDHIIARLYAWRDPASGRPLVEQVWKREEVYSGPYAERADDLLIRWTDVVPRGLDEQWADGVEQPHHEGTSGGHKPNGIVILRGEGILPGATIAGAQLMDMAPTILYLLGEPVPAAMDGKVLTQAVSRAYLVAHPVVYDQKAADVDVAPSNGLADGVYSDEDTRVVEARLRELGYLA